MTACPHCGHEISAGDLMGWDPDHRSPACFACADTIGIEINRAATHNVEALYVWNDAKSAAERRAARAAYVAACARFVEIVALAERIGEANKRAWEYPRAPGDQPAFYTPNGQRRADLGA